jgi:magnesium transporter
MAEVITAAMIGALLPLVGAKLQFDPALVVSPSITTTLLDVSGLRIYFSTTRMLLDL